MATKKGEGVRGVLGDLVSREREKKERIAQPTEATTSPVPEEPQPEPPQVSEEQGGHQHEARTAASPQPRKSTAIKGRPREKKDKTSPRGVKTKVTLSIDEQLRERFYRLAYRKMMQPGEFVELALQFYIEHHQNRD